MPPKKEFRGPSNFCEWVVGTTIPTILGPEKRSRKQKPTKRGVIRVEVTTDDESAEDTLKISYPRDRSSRKKVSTTSSKSKPKKVRFEQVPTKSALKKAAKTYVVSEAPEDEDKTSDSSADPSSDSSRSRVILIPESKLKIHTVKVSDDSKTDDSSENESAASSEPSPTCKCIGCIRGRQKLAKRRRRALVFRAESSESDDDSELETDDYDEAKKNSKKKNNNDEKKKKKKKKKKQEVEKVKDKQPPKKDKKKKTPEPATVETDDSESEAKADADDESSDSEDNGKKQKQKQKNKQQKGSKDGKEQQSEKKQADKDDKKKGSSSKKEEKDAVDSKKEEKDKKATDSDKSKLYPEAMPGPNLRRPNLIAPIRAQVVQVEDVVESQEDPPPNSYYDKANNVLRSYHGPVYGGFQNGGLYPKRDPKHTALPTGTAHPLRNPYFYGFNNAPPQLPRPGQENGPEAQWPPGAWPGMPWPYAPPYGQIPPAADAPPPVKGSKGAFSDRAGRNNVAPDGVEANPYYKKQQTSPFRSYAKNSPSYGRQGWKTGSRHGSATGWNNDGAAGSVKQTSPSGDWDQNSGNQKQDAGTWDGTPTQKPTRDWNTGATAQATWDTGQPAQTTEQSWGNTNDQNQQDDAGPAVATQESNVMPGTFDANPAPTWGDTTMAADTHGAVDQETPLQAAEW